VAVDDPADLVRRLRSAGIDASAATSKLAVVPPPAGRPEAAMARATLERLVCLPAYPELPEPAFRRMLDVVRQAHARDCADWRSRA
jgi:hypothetical protein